MEATRTRLTAPAARKKLLGSVAVLGVAAAVAGFGTYSTFNDTTTPVNTQITSGVLSLSLKDNGAVATVPFAGGTFLAGDSQSKPLDLVNDGDTALASVTMTSSATASSALDTDPTNGLQLTLTSCSVPWTSGSSWSCSGTTHAFYSGPVITSQVLSGAASLAAGGVDHLLLTALLPSTASGAAFQNVSSTLSFVFTGAQRSGSAH